MLPCPRSAARRRWHDCCCGAECVASSRIEGLAVGARRLLRADAARALGDRVSDVAAAEVLANIDAMAWGLDTAPDAEITLETLLETHRRLMAGTRLSEHGGRIRTQQNWIGGSDFNPCSAVTDGSPCSRRHADERSKTPGGSRRVFANSKHRGRCASDQPGATLRCAA